jgi:two-component system, chemotaxis family, CheB/CheR fusion protein
MVGLKGKRTSKTSKEAILHENLRLKRELAETWEQLCSITQAREILTEQLQSAYEQSQQTNEELKTNNEELQAMTEELRVANEELSRVNQQLQARSDDLCILVSSVRMPIVMLGSDLRIRQFTPRAQKVFNLCPGDVCSR